MPKGLAMMLDEAKGGGSDKEDAAQDLIDAIKDGDAKGVALAFETLYELCSGGESEGEEEAEDEEEVAYGG